MATSLLCRMGYHKFAPWQNVEVASASADSTRSPRRQMRRMRRCSRCGLEHTDYSPQEGMQVSPPGAA
jgi:hypothetical protein